MGSTDAIFNETVKISMNGLLTLYNTPVVMSLIKNNVILYGGAVREAACSTDALYKYMDGTGGAIVGYTDIKFMEIIERDMYAWQACEPVTDSVSVTNVLKRMYFIHVKPQGEFPAAQPTICVRINYIRQLLGNTAITAEALCGSAHDFDVNLLQLDREGIGIRYVPPSMSNHPAPIVEILNNCRNRRFKIISGIPSDTTSENWLVSRVIRMVSMGWIPIDRKVKVHSQSPEDRCSICHENYAEKSKVLTLVCKHSYHPACWEEHAQHSMQATHCPHITTCPLCRYPLHRWEQL